MDNDKFDSEKVKAQGILNKEGIKPVVKLFIQRFGIEAGLNSIKNLVAMLLYCSLNEKDDAFKQFIILFTQKINDEENRFVPTMMMTFTDLLLNWSELLKPLIFTDLAECKSASGSTAACAASDDTLESFVKPMHIGQISSYKNALSCTALYLQKRNIFTRDTVETLLESVKQMVIFHILYTPPPHASETQSANAETDELIKLAERTVKLGEILPFDKAKQLERLPHVIILVDECSQPPRDYGRLFAKDSRRVTADTSPIFPDDMHDLMLKTLFQIKEKHLKIKDENIHRLTNAEISRQKQIISTQKKLISNALVDAKSERDDALEILATLTLTKSNLQSAESYTTRAETAANRTKESFEKVKKAAGAIIASCIELYKDDVNVITESRTAKTTVQADAAIEASLQANQTCEQEVRAEVALIEDIVSEAQKYATAARTALTDATKQLQVQVKAAATAAAA